MKKILLGIALVLLSATASAQHRVERDTLRINGKAIGVTVTNWYCIEGDECPEFTVYKENGEPLRRCDLSGKTAVISFWITTCGPCRRELNRVGPELVDIYSSDEFVFVAIGSGEDAESVKKFRELSGATFPLCYDPSGEVFHLFADNGFPKLFVVDKNGIIRMVEKGYSEDKFNHLKETVRQLVEEKLP